MRRQYVKNKWTDIASVRPDSNENKQEYLVMQGMAKSLGAGAIAGENLENMHGLRG